MNLVDDQFASFMVPVNLQDQMVPGSLEFAIHYLVDNEIDLSGFEARFRNDEEGRPGYDPRILLKVVLTGYSRGIVHSRKLERACRENVIFMAMACGQTPDHSTIAHFVSSMQDLILAVFRDILLVCDIEKDRQDKEDEGREGHKNKEKQILRLKRRAEKIGRFLEEDEPKKSGGQTKVNVQWLIFCMIHNIEKIVNFGAEFA